MSSAPRLLRSVSFFVSHLEVIMNQTQQPILLRLPNVVIATGLARSTLYKLMSAGSFPMPVRLTNRAVAWSRIDIEAWIASRQRIRGS